MIYDAIICGGGIAGLTSASFLSKQGFNILLCEKEAKLGGLVNSFEHNDFTFDGGIRAMEDSGIVSPMLRQLGIDIDFVKNKVSIGFEDKIIHLESKTTLEEYQNLLTKIFPQNKPEILKIIEEIKKVMSYMDVLYGIDNGSATLNWTEKIGSCYY